ncbi:MAG: sulfotransferase domain-containing protein [Verrucomicrobiales bacterium]
MVPKKPTFLIIGSAKCGTTALASILSAHPDCCFSQPKEVSFFQDTINLEPNPHYPRGWDWYQQAFRHYSGEAQVGEGTPSYSDRTRSPLTASRIHRFNPDCKIVYMVRDPLARQISAWSMGWAEAHSCIGPHRREVVWAVEGFAGWLERQGEIQQWDECRYGFQLAAYEELFPPENILVSFLEDWRSRKVDEVSRIMRFLELDPDLWDSTFQEEANRAENRLVERQGLIRLRRHPATKAIAGWIPKGWRDWAHRRVSCARITTPAPDTQNENCGRFRNYVAADAVSFLSRFGKPRSFWPSVAGLE